MTPLYEDHWFTFRFDDDRIVPRFHLEGVEQGRRVSIFKIDALTGERQDLLATAVVGAAGWVDLAAPLLVRAGDAFIAVVDRASLCESCRHMREITTPKGSRFLLCQLSSTDPEFAKYPRQPVLECTGFMPAQACSNLSSDSGSASR